MKRVWMVYNDEDAACREVGFSLVQESPRVSLAGGPASTHYCCRRLEVELGARLVEYETVGPQAGRIFMEVMAMQVAYQRCAVLDVHKREIVVAVRIEADGKVSHEIRRFSTMTPGLLALSGYTTRDARMWRWKRQVYIGSQSGMCWRRISS